MKSLVSLVGQGFSSVRVGVNGSILPLLIYLQIIASYLAVS